VDTQINRKIPGSTTFSSKSVSI